MARSRWIVLWNRVGSYATPMFTVLWSAPVSSTPAHALVCDPPASYPRWRCRSSVARRSPGRGRGWV